jgi:putative glycosyltransferase (TIGR04372 family)
MRYGREKLKELGVPEGEPFMCFHVRDPAYLEDISNTESMPNSTHQHRDAFDENWQPHGYRDASIQDYIPAAEEMTGRGYYAVRMGAVVRDPMVFDNPLAIDYAATARSDFMDVFLSSQCDFFLCSQTGMGILPMIFRRPCVHVNWASYSLLTNWNPKDLCIFKKFWLPKEQRFLNFREILSTEIRTFELNEDFERLDIELVDNTPLEISDTVCEMDDRLKGVWQSEPGDEELQAQFWGLFEICDGKKVDSCRVGAKFLRENAHLLQ